jgi:signal transduction histidine kinase
VSKPIRILLIEDSEEDAEIILRTLRGGDFAPEHLRVETAEAMIAALDEVGWNLVISDYRLPTFSAPDALELLKETGLDVPFIIVSGTISEDIAVESMRAGARDFLVKDKLARLNAAVQRELRAADDRRSQREEERRNRDLEQARDQAERENRFKSQVLASMSHELRTPLNAIIGFSELLVDQKAGALSDKQTGYIEDILRSGHHLLALINDILDLSKAAAGRLELDVTTIAVGPLVTEVISMLQPQTQAKQIAIERALPEVFPEVLADTERLKQILCNLLSNAVKFTPVGGKVTVRGAMAGTSEEPAEDCLQISVIDTGIGIRAEDQERIFGEFEQVRLKDVSSRQGTGLGLALARRLVELHGGRLWVESAGEGQGSAFHLTLPISL